MRKMSKAAKAEAYDEVAHERDVLSRVAWFTFNNVVPDATEIVVDGDGFQYYYLYGAMDADGGTLVNVYRYDGQSAHVRAFSFEEWIKICADLSFGIGCNTDVRIACDRLKTARQKLYEGPKSCPGTDEHDCFLVAGHPGPHNPKIRSNK